MGRYELCFVHYYAANSLCQSSLTLALLRCIITEGKVYYDGLPTDSINLDALRSSITIIPQVVRTNAWTCHLL